MIAKHMNMEYSGGFPLNAGDRYYSQDLGRDYHYLLDRLGLLAQDIIGERPLIVSGGVVSKGGSADEINITPCVGYVEFEVDVPNSFASLPPSVSQEDIEMKRVVSIQQTNLDISATATLDGSTTNYVKLNYAEADGASRTRAKKAGSYAYDQSPSFAIVVDDTAPTDKDIVLLAFTWDGVLANALEKIGGQRSPMLLDLLAVKSKYPENDIINGGFNFWQRGTSFNPILNTEYSADRWQYSEVGAMIHRIDRSTDVPSSSPFDINYSILVDCTNASGGLAVGEYAFISQKIEGYNFKKYVRGFGTLSFWVKGTKTGVHCVSFRNSGAERSYVVEYAINITNTWEYKIITIPLDNFGGTWDYINGIGLSISWALAAGSTFQTTADDWVVGNFFATSNQVDATDNAANDFRLAKVKFELGQVATPFVAIDQEQELARCQRYYEKSYKSDVDPGTVTAVGKQRFFINNVANSAFQIEMTTGFKTSKRAVPTVTSYSASAGNSGKVDLVGEENAAISNTNENSFTNGGTTVGASTGRVLHYHFTADSEL